jgi:hypothetical protein
MVGSDVRVQSARWAPSCVCLSSTGFRYYPLVDNRHLVPRVRTGPFTWMFWYCYLELGVEESGCSEFYEVSLIKPIEFLDHFLIPPSKFISNTLYFAKIISKNLILFYVNFAEDLIHQSNCIHYNFCHCEFSFMTIVSIKSNLLDKYLQIEILSRQFNLCVFLCHDIYIYIYIYIYICTVWNFNHYQVYFEDNYSIS